MGYIDGIIRTTSKATIQRLTAMLFDATQELRDARSNLADATATIASYRSDAEYASRQIGELMAEKWNRASDTEIQSLRADSQQLHKMALADWASFQPFPDVVTLTKGIREKWGLRLMSAKTIADAWLADYNAEQVSNPFLDVPSDELMAALSGFEQD